MKNEIDEIMDQVSALHPNELIVLFVRMQTLCLDAHEAGQDDAWLLAAQAMYEARTAIENRSGE